MHIYYVHSDKHTHKHTHTYIFIGLYFLPKGEPENVDRPTGRDRGSNRE